MDERLLLIASMVPPCRGVADVGADHGLLICRLVEEGRAQWGLATDIHRGPLEKARQEAQARGLGGRIRCLLADGLGETPREGLDAVVIAGMGGDTMIHILEAWPHAKSPGITWLLQPMTKAERLREWLWRSGFEILREPCCRAAGRVYSVMEAVWTGREKKPEAAELYLGRVDPGAGEESRAYCAGVLERASRRAKGAALGGDREEAERAGEILAAIREALPLWEEEKGQEGTKDENQRDLRGNRQPGAL